VTAVATLSRPSVRGAVAALSLFALLPALGTSIANVALPTIGTALGASFADVQWVVLIYLMAVTALSVVAGRLGDVFGRRRLLLTGAAIYAAASAACSAVPTLPALVAGRAAQGVGAAIMMALGLSFVADVIPVERTGSAMGLLATMSSVGTALGPSLGGALIAAFGWRAVFEVCVPLGVLAVALAWRYLPAKQPARRRVRQSLRTGPWRDPATRAGLMLTALISAVVMASLVVGPFYLSGAIGLDAARVGLTMSVGPIVAALTGAPAGRLVDAIGSSRLTIVGLTAMLAGAAGMMLTSSSLGVPGYIAPLAVITSGYALFQTANNAAVMSRARLGQRGATSGALSFARHLGLVTGTSLMSTVFAAATASHAGASRAAVLTSGLHATYAGASVLIAVALVLARFAPPLTPFQE
jgi:MFS family permease